MNTQVEAVYDLFKLFPESVPYIGKNFFTSKRRVLIVGYAAKPSNMPLMNNASFFKEHGLNADFAGISNPTRILFGNTSFSATLRKRINMNLPDVNLDDIAFCNFIPATQDHFHPRTISRNDRLIATELLEKLIKILEPHHVVFYGNVAQTEEIGEFLAKNKISFATISLRSDFSSKQYDASDQNASAAQLHGLPKLLQLGNEIKANIGLIPDEVRSSIEILLGEIDFMTAASSKANTADAARDKRIQKYVFIDRVAQELKAIDRTMYMKDLATLLNANGFRTALGKEFDPESRGVSKLIDATIHYFKDNDRDNGERIAQDIMDRLIYNDQPDMGKSVSAAFLTTPLERKYGYRSASFNISISQHQEELEKVFGQDIPEAYAPKNK